MKGLTLVINGPTIAFFILSAIILSSAVYIVTTKNIMRAVFVHLLALSCVGGLYILLYAQFIAMMQILIYAGAVTIMVLFALMLTRAQQGGLDLALDIQQRWMALLTAAIFFGMLMLVEARKVWQVASKGITHILTVQQFGKILFSGYVLPFELISVLLLVALVGVIVLASKEE